MIVVKFSRTITELPCDIICDLGDHTYVLDCDLSSYDIISSIVSTHVVENMHPADIDIISSFITKDTPYITISPQPRLDDVIDAIAKALQQPPSVVCFSWQTPRNYVLDYWVSKLISYGHKVVCSGGNTKLPVMDLSPVAVDGVVRVAGDSRIGDISWIDCYDYIVHNVAESNNAAHFIAEKLFDNIHLTVDYRLDFYSDPTVRSAPWAKRLVTDQIKHAKAYEFLPVANLRYIAGEQLLPVKQGDCVSINYGNVPLFEFTNPIDIELTTDMPRGVTFDKTNGWLYGTFKYKQNMFHRFVITLNNHTFELHMISCDYDNKPTYDECKKKYFNQIYDAPPFSIREYWMPMSKPIKILEPGDPWIRTYNLNDLHLYRKEL